MVTVRIDSKMLDELRELVRFWRAARAAEATGYLKVRPVQMDVKLGDEQETAAGLAIVYDEEEIDRRIAVMEAAGVDAEALDEVKRWHAERRKGKGKGDEP